MKLYITVPYLKSIILSLGLFITSMLSAQNPLVNNDIYINNSNYTPFIKDALKQSDLPEIKDSVRKIENIKYNINSNPILNKYQVSSISHAKMVNEPLSKIYYSLIKAGFGLYTTPYLEVFLNNLRTRDMSYGIHYKHLSSHSKVKYTGFSGFSDDEAQLYAKKFYKKHTLSGDLNYSRNAVHFYGFEDSIQKIDDKNFTFQRFQLFEVKGNLLSHYTDSAKINHEINLKYYNLGDYHNSYENNVFADGLIKTFISGEKLNVYASADYYNNRSKSDTISNFIFKINPYFEAGGEKWGAVLGVSGVIDKFSNSNSAKFYFYPRLDLHYNVYNNLIVPYVGLSGGLEKNSFKSLTSANPFIISEPVYANTNNKYNLFGGLRGMMSANTSYDARVSYGKYSNMPFYLINFDYFLSNKFKVVYNDVNLLTVSGQVKYQMKEKFHLLLKGNYYDYKLDSNTYAWHKPNYDITLSGVYNLKSKFIIKADIYAIGNQWALKEGVDKTGTKFSEKKLLKGIVDINLGAEYRYSKMLSFFVSFNNIGNFRYYRWDQYPTQRFNGMIGITFVPF